MTFEELLSMSKEDRAKLRKVDILNAIDSGGWQYGSAKRQVADLESKLKVVEAPYEAAKLILLGMVGGEVPRDEFSGSPNLDKVELMDLVGRVIAKVAK